MKNGLIAAVCLLMGMLWAYLVSAIFALLVAFVLSFILDPFLAIINIQFLSERLAGLSVGKLFIFVFTIRLIVGVFIPVRANAGETK